MSSTILTSKPMRDAKTLTRPTFTVPAGACDSHVHVFEANDRYPSVATPHYTLPDGSLGELRRMTEALSLQRFIIVQPSYYGTDNSCMLDALAAAGAAARGVVMVEPNSSEQKLIDLHARGVRALRLDLFLRSSWPTADIIATGLSQQKEDGNEAGDSRIDGATHQKKCSVSIKKIKQPKGEAIGLAEAECA